MKQCMMRINATGYIGEWQRRLPDRFPGNRRDSVNVLYPILPDDDFISDVVPLSSDEMLNVDIFDFSGINFAHDRIIAIGKILLGSADGFIVVANYEQWTEMYNSAYWRLWCAPFFSFDEYPEGLYQADLAEIGVVPETTREQAREVIKNRIAG
jgi:hypothetical protein